MRCPRCAEAVPGGAGACPACGAPVPVPLEVVPAGRGGGDPEVVEPEIVGGFDPGGAAGGRRPGPPAQVGCTLGPGCGCLALPLAVVGGVLAASVLAVAWVLRAGQTVGAIGGILSRLLGGKGSRGPRGR